MKWFETYSSNTLGGTGNQVHFSTEGQIRTGRIYYKIFAGGTYNYSLLFSNIMDSTYKFGADSHCNQICHSWQILKASIGLCKNVTNEIATDPEVTFPLTFGGSQEKTVMPGEFFTSDPVLLSAEKGDFLCYEITYCGTMIPYHLESILPTFVYEDGQWIQDKKVPVPGMIGCDRKVKAKIGYLGDSITQGVGTTPNAYSHWCALISEEIGEAYSYWNLGIGYAKGQDAASDGAWLYKAKQMDALVVSYGSNDIGRGRSLELMKEDFKNLVDTLKNAGIKVFLQSVPPFDWQDEPMERWKALNEYLVNELSEECDGFLNITPLLVDYDAWEGRVKYSNRPDKHPNEEGCRIWADALLPEFREFIKKLD